MGGLYVPIRAIVPHDEGTGHLFVVEHSEQEGATGNQETAVKTEVSLHESVGEYRRVEGAIGEGTQVIVQGASYLKDREPVSVVRVDGERP